MKKIFYILILFFVLTNCNNQGNTWDNSFWTCREKLITDSVEYIIFGNYAGMCEKNCSPLYKLKNDTLLIDTINQDFYKGFPPNNFNVMVSKDKLAKATTIKKNIPCFLLNVLAKEFGRPDDHDQGGYYLEFKYKRLTHSFTFDKMIDSIPKELRPFMRTISSFHSDEK